MSSYELERRVLALEAKVERLEGLTGQRQRKSIKMRQMLENPEDVYPLQIVEVKRRCALVLKNYDLMKKGQGPWAGHAKYLQIAERKGWMPLKLFYYKMDQCAPFVHTDGTLPDKAKFHFTVKQILKDEAPEWKLMNPSKAFAEYHKCEDFVWIPFEKVEKKAWGDKYVKRGGNSGRKKKNTTQQPDSI